MGGSSEEDSLHIAILPWLAFGHLIPFLHLSIALATLGLRISFLSTPKNIRRLPKIPSHLTSRIKFIHLPLPSVPNLPDDAESTADLSSDDTPLLKTAYDLLSDPINQFIVTESPDWILHDFVPHWILDIAGDHKIPCVFFSVYASTLLSFFGPPESLTEEGRRRRWPSWESLASTPEWITFPSTVAFTPREAETFYAGAFPVNTSGISDVDRFRISVAGCKAVAVRSCNEYEGEYLDLLGGLYGKPVIPIGLLPSMPPCSSERPAEHDGTFGWLDGQKARSVVFISFGSEYKLTRNDVHELAYGLEQSDVPFFWALRRPSWATGDDEEVLPEGFAGRVEGRGMVTFGWAPQTEILAHPSIGGSFFHSGWGSIIEILYHGHVLVLMPSIYDQGLNARLLVERGLGIEVKRNDDGSFNGNEIASSLRLAMVSGEGEKFRKNAREMGVVFSDHALHDRYVNKFVDYLRKERRN